MRLFLSGLFSKSLHKKNAMRRSFCIYDWGCKHMEQAQRLSETELDTLAGFFDLLAAYDAQDKAGEVGGANPASHSLDATQIVGRGEPIHGGK